MNTTTQQKTVIHTEQKASGEIDDLQKAHAEEQAGGIMDTIKDSVMAGVESLRDGVNYITERVTGAETTSDTHVDVPANGKPVTVTKETTEINPEVERRSKIVEQQTRYPNQQGYGVNPKFKEDHDSGALADIKSGLKKGVENVKESAKEFKDDVKEGVHELKNNVKEGWEDVKIEANKMTDAPPPRTYAGAAARMESKGDQLLDESREDFNKAAKAQAKANREATKANIKANEALNKQQRGEAHLAAAGKQLPPFNDTPS